MAALPEAQNSGANGSGMGTSKTMNSNKPFLFTSELSKVSYYSNAKLNNTIT